MLNNWVMAAADIDGVGEQLVRRLWDIGLVRSLPELYRLTKEQLLELDGFGEISATNAIDQIEASRTRVPFSRVLLGLNISGIGWVLAQNLARHVGNVDALIGATPEELRELGLAFELSDEERPVEGRLTGNQYAITGTLESMSREEARARLEALGA